MQITIKLKGFLKIAFFLSLTIAAVSFMAYKAYYYISYKKIMYETDRKQKRKLQFQTFVKADDHTTKGYFLLSSIATYHGKNLSRIIIMDPDGQVLMEKQMDGIIYDFRQWHNGGHTFYSYAINNTRDSLANKLSSCGHIVILDSALNELKQVHLKSHGDVVVNKKQDLDLHDFIMFSETHYMTMALYPKTVSNIPACLFPAPKVRVLVPVIQEVSNDSVIWQWDASKYPEFYLTSNAGNKFYDTTTPQDYIHMNSMTVDTRDSNLILSFLNQNQVLKINRRSGDIMWRLGGKNSDFPLTSDKVFLRQHNATLVDSNYTLLLLDNGDDSIRAYSRVLEFKLDEQKKTIASFKSYNVPARIIGSRGSVQKINSDYIICGGISDYILVVNSITGVKKAEIKADQSFYRAYLVNDISGVNLNQKQKE